MKCPYCQSEEHRVVGRGQAKADINADYKRRRRECIKCGRYFWTVEEYVPDAYTYGQKKRKERNGQIIRQAH